jgi:hypothetical protein
MANIEREVLWCNTAECDGPAIEDPEDPGNCDECAQPLERVEVVRADAYRGAVEAERARIVAWLRTEPSGYIGPNFCGRIADLLEADGRQSGTRSAHVSRESRA